MSKKAKTKQVSGGSTMAALQERLQQAMGLHQHGYLAQAEGLYKEILAIQPRHVDALHLLGMLAAQTQRADIGVQLIEQALAINPHHAAMHSNLGNALMALGRHEDAARAYGKAVTLKPEFADAHCNRGNALKALQRYDEAVASYRKALALNPALADAHANLGNTLCAMHRHADGLQHLDKALSLRPQFPEAINGRGTALCGLHRYDEALASFDQAIALKPDGLEAHANRGNALRELGRFEQARQSYERALALRPHYVDALANLAVTLQETGDVKGAMALDQQALSLAPTRLDIHSNLLFALSCAPGITPQEYLAQAQAYGQAAQAGVSPFTQWPGAALDGVRPLRVGLVSGDLGDHPVGYFLEAMLAQVDPMQVTLLAYPTTLDQDALTARLRAHFDTWTPIASLGDEAAARQIHADHLDVLIDLSGHTAGNRLPVLAWRPAPVQASWLGYFASTGLPSIDWIIADPVSVPVGTEAELSERVARLPASRLCFTPPAEAPNVSPLPALTQGCLTLGCFQALTKLSDEVLQAWAEILRRLPQARLRLQNRALGDDGTRQRWSQRLADAGIDASRTHLHGPVDRATYLAAHAEVDLLLDTFPFPGGTTTCEALWMGVPTLTLAGTTMLARQGAMMMNAVGLPDWIAQDTASYVDLAVRHAGDLGSLAAVRGSLREKARQSPLFNARLFADQWQRLLREMALTAPTARKSP